MGCLPVKSTPLAFALLFGFAINLSQGFVFNTSSPTCGISAIPPSPILPACAANASATIQEAISRASLYAPVVHFHPLEQWHLQTPSYWFENAQLYLTDGKPKGNSTYDFIYDSLDTYILLTPHTYVTVINNTNLSEEEKTNILAGAPFDSKNHSTAQVTFTVYDYEESYFMYNFNLYYSWNGCSNQAISLNFDGDRNITNYLMCPTGVHEADWERVSVLVCKSDWKIKRIAYSQHSWAEERDCTVEGQCPFDPETGNPVTYAGLDGHGNYPESNNLMVYEFVSGNFSADFQLQNLGGVYIADRTFSDPYRKWVPRPDLLAYIPPLLTLNDTDVMTRFGWAAYAGNWGAPLQLPSVYLECLNPTQTERYLCPPEYESTTLILQVLKLVQGVPGVSELAGAGDEYVGATVSNSTVVGYPGIPGPMARGFSYTWVPGPIPNIQTKNMTTLLCPDDTPLGNDLPSIDPAVFDVSINTLINYLVGVAAGGVAFSILLAIIMALPVIMDKSGKVHQMVTTKANLMAARAAATARKAGRAAQSATTKAKEIIPGMKSSGSPVSAIGPADEETGQMVVENDQEESSQLSPQRSDELQAFPMPSTEAGFSAPLPSATSTLSLEEMELELKSEHNDRARSLVWFVVSLSLFAAGLGLSIYGTVKIFDDSIISAAMHRFNVQSVGYTLKVLFISALAVIGFFDVLTIVLLFFKEREIKIFKYRIRNYLGGYQWLNKHAFEMYVVFIGFMLIVVTVSVLFFAIGFMVTIVQVAARIACKSVMKISVFGQSPLDVCFTLPFIQEGQICGWEAMAVCANITNMDVAYVMIGSMMLIWCHLVWLVALVINLERNKTHRIVLKRAESTPALDDLRSKEVESVDEFSS